MKKEEAAEKVEKKSVKNEKSEKNTAKTAKKCEKKCKNSKKDVITKEMTIGDALKISPNLEEVFLGFGMHCISCPISQMETIEEAAMVHGVDENFLLSKLNENLK